MNKKPSMKILRLLQKMQGYQMRIEDLGDDRVALRDKKTSILICKVAQRHIKHLAARGLLERRGVDLVLSDVALKFIQRAGAGDDGFLAQHRTTESVEVREGGVRWQALQNEEESPLKVLYRRKTKTGASFLSQAEFEAGERLRRDFTFAALMPSVTMRWQEKLGGSSGNDKADFSDQTLAARYQINKALGAVGPELGGLLIDVCCFLKGMEVVERERGWPARSAKVVLKTALIALARHYRPKGHMAAPQQYHILRDIQEVASV